MGVMARGSALVTNLGLSQILELPNRSISWNLEGMLNQVGDRVERDIATLRGLKKAVQAVVLLVTSGEIDLDTDRSGEVSISILMRLDRDITQCVHVCDDSCTLGRYARKPLIQAQHDAHLSLSVL